MITISYLLRLLELEPCQLVASEIVSTSGMKGGPTMPAFFFLMLPPSVTVLVLPITEEMQGQNPGEIKREGDAR